MNDRMNEFKASGVVSSPSDDAPLLEKRYEAQSLGVHIQGGIGAGLAQKGFCEPPDEEGGLCLSVGEQCIQFRLRRDNPTPFHIQ